MNRENNRQIPIIMSFENLFHNNTDIATSLALAAVKPAFCNTNLFGFFAKRLPISGIAPNVSTFQ